ncbi:MAG TPA: hypothetical protein VFO85_02285, partial [Vicinamibacteria bacterium]|nr:hypothetical protein [Vicinamibacteria bacterium]
MGTHPNGDGWGNGNGTGNGNGNANGYPPVNGSDPAPVKGKGLGRRRRPRPGSQTALVCAGGGVTGIAYEAGCVAALEALLGRSAATFDTYIGISAGAVVTSLVANGISATEVCAEMAKGSGRLFGVPTGGLFHVPAGDAFRALRILPRLAGRLLARRASGLSAAEIVMSALSGLPAGLVDNSGVRESMARVLGARGTDSFADLGRRLYILAVELDSGQV